MALSFSIEQSFACAPHTPQDVFIARYQTVTANQANMTHFKVELSAEKFIFRSTIDEFRYTKSTQWHSSFAIQHIPKEQIIIGLAYAPDGNNADEYQIVSFAKLNCENDRVSISKSIAPFLAWNKQTSNCMHRNNETVDILDGFIEHDQKYYLAKIQKQYPTCKKLREAFPASSVEDNDHVRAVFKSMWERLIKWLKFWL